MTAVAPTLDWSDWSGLENLLRQKYRTVRTLTDPVMPGASVANWVYSPAGTLSYNAESPAGFYSAQCASAASIGAAAAIRVASSAGGSSPMQFSPNNIGALAVTLEGLHLGGSGGFDFQLGFPGQTSTVGGCSFWQNNGQLLGQVNTYDASGNLTTSPRSVSDAVTNGTTLLTSATAAFVSADVGQPVTAAGTILIPGTIIAAVNSATSVTLSLPALSSASGQAVSIGQVPNVNLTDGVFGEFNLSFVWWTVDGYAWVMMDDQVLAEINVGAARYYNNAQPVIVQSQVISRDGSSHSFVWDQMRVSVASNGND